LARLKRDRDGALAFHDLIGHDGGLANAIDYSHKAATSDVPVLLTGPISAGKELLARAIHGQSRRTGAPFITVHCGSVSANALEAILFGEETPHSRTIGKLREAERGTIFLDEIHTLPLNIQSKLLRVLQHREIEPIGTKKPVKVNVRIISATHHDLKAEMRTGNFREDLYFSLNVLTIAVPSLRERKQDIIPLAEHFLQHYSSLDALPLRSLSADARHYLTDYLWPGNIRELEGLIHRALVLGEGDTIDTRLLKQIHEADAVEGITGEHALHMNLRKPDGFFKTMDQIEKEVMDQALDYYQHNIAHAAQALGMAKSTFYRKLKE
jgi:DNA-binding NtrC family response regulator